MNKLYGKAKVNNDGNRFCGPAALSVITGRTTNEVAAEILKVRGKPYLNPESVTGAWSSELEDVLDRLDYEHTRPRFLSGGSLYFLLSTQLNEPGWYIITLPHHFVTIQVVNNKEKYLCDNHTKSQINAAMSARLSQQVVEVIKVIPPQPKFNLMAEYGLGL